MLHERQSSRRQALRSLRFARPCEYSLPRVTTRQARLTTFSSSTSRVSSNNANEYLVDPTKVRVQPFTITHSPSDGEDFVKSYQADYPVAFLRASVKATGRIFRLTRSARYGDLLAEDPDVRGDVEAVKRSMEE